MQSRALVGLCCLLVLLGISGRAAAADARRLVLVAHAESKVAPLTLPTLRRLYLGAEMTQDGHRIVPVRNLTDPVLYEVFLQKVIHLSANRYERLLVSKVFQRGGKRFATASTSVELDRILGDNPSAVSYMWQDTALANRNIKILGQLWEGTVE